MPLAKNVRLTGEVLHDVGVGLPPKNNPIFGVVKGNPVILVVDESTSMDAIFTLGHDTFTRREFCNLQLEAVLEGLPNGTYFNVIQYSGSAVKIFENPMLVNKTSIGAAMEAMGTVWRDKWFWTAGQDPSQMLQRINAFALRFKHPLKDRSTKRNSLEALQLAYATADLPSQQVRVDDSQLTLPENDFVNSAVFMNKGVPQIYFLTSGQPDGGASQILNNIDALDKGSNLNSTWLRRLMRKRRNIPVNSIAFTNPGDLVAKKFVMDLAQKTGGFFRSIEQ